MSWRRDMVVGACLLLQTSTWACGRPRREVEPDLTLPKSVPTATTRSTNPRTSRACEDFARRQLEAITNVARRLGIDANRPPERHHVGYCAMTGGGSWRLAAPSLVDVTSAEELWFAVQARYVVVFQPTDGAPAEFPVLQRLLQYGTRLIHDPLLYDFDGDGTHELFVDVEEMGDEGHYARQADLWTYRLGRVVPYDPTTSWAFETLEDIDGDQRPDLLMLRGYDDWLEHCASGFPFDQPAPLFVAHALSDGTFVGDDATAKAFARRWCPSKPTAVTSSQSALCARLWVHSPAELAAARRMVLGSCTPWSCVRELSGRPQAKRATQDCERRTKWFERDPPFSLP